MGQLFEVTHKPFVRNLSVIHDRQIVVVQVLQSGNLSEHSWHIFSGYFGNDDIGHCDPITHDLEVVK